MSAPPGKVDVYGLMDAHAWLGQFWYPDGSQTFAGRLHYTLEDGIELEYVLPSQTRPSRQTAIFGVLPNGQPCTLYGTFDPTRHGSVTGARLYQGKRSFLRAIVGVHEEDDENCTFDKVHIQLTNLEEFVHPQGFKLSAEAGGYNVLVEKQIAGYLFRLVQVSSFVSLFPEEIDSHLFTESDPVKSSLSNLKGAIEESLGLREGGLMLRTDVSWYIELEFAAPTAFPTVIAHTRRISDLFNLLLQKPVLLKSLTGFRLSEKDRYNSFPLLISSYANPWTARLAGADTWHWHLPFRLEDLNMGEIVQRWHEISEDRAAAFLANELTHKTGWTSENDNYGTLILLLTQLELITSEIGGGDDVKYELPISQFADLRVIHQLEKLLKVSGAHEIGVQLSALRAEIVHPKRKQKLLNRLTLRERVHLTELLRLVVTTHVLVRLGFPLGDAQAIQFS